MGALLMQLAGEHKLSLGDKVSQYIEGVPNGDTMTLRQVADLTSGVASYTADPAFMQALFSDPSSAGARASCWRSVFAPRPCSAREPPSSTPTATTCCSGW
jgi:CubicO group peptidase (beta-lactamase class C family)